MNECNDPDHGAINAERSESRGLRKAWIDGLRSGIDYASDQLHTVTEQRDRLAARERQWLPIESAPKDGTQILSFAEWEGITVCSWLDYSEVWETTEKMGWAKNYDTVAMSYETFEPTHWMPLPPNPPTNPNRP